MKLQKKHLKTFYTLMNRTRKLDELLVESLQEGKLVGFYHSGQGEEAVGVGACTFNMKDDDYLYPHHRAHALGFSLARGLSPKGWVASHFGKAAQDVEGPTSEERGIFGMSGTIGGGFVMSLGWALSCKMAKKDQVTVSFFGDGASGRGTLHEAMNMASVQNLPIVWVCDNNLYGQWMPISDAFARDDIADLAHGYNMPGIVVDGQDPIAVHEAVGAAIDRARAGDGPSLVECKTYRYRGHSEGAADMAHHGPRPAEEMAAWKKRDPLLLFKEKMLKQKIFTKAELTKIEKEADKEKLAMAQYADDCPRAEVQDPSILDHWLYAE
jgi:acetoin:2,6-dichlorophenolindophenol oxidoreductase subunit alpha